MFLFKYFCNNWKVVILAIFMHRHLEYRIKLENVHKYYSDPGPQFIGHIIPSQHIQEYLCITVYYWKQERFVTISRATQPCFKTNVADFTYYLKQ